MFQKHKIESIDSLLAQVCRLHHARAHVLLEGVGLYRGQPPVLHLLWEKEGRTHSEIANHLHIQPATVTKMVRRMERAGFLVSRQDQDDQRVYRLYLTEKGRGIQGEVQQIWTKLEEEALEGFSAEEHQLLRELFIKVRENLLRVI